MSDDNVPSSGFQTGDGALLPNRIGHYKVLQVLGEGGMGIVYEAKQLEPVRRSVALKIIKLGMDTKQIVARFETERQALAVMDHPGIAKVFDAGATETGRPYFAMELVKGIPLTDYCDLHKLSTIERLRLFIKLCNAVQHAHQKGVIHRDLKPSNVLVTLQEGEPHPKVIDFGIAKAIGRQLTDKTLVTQHGTAVGTPEYMSPEQAEMSGLDVDTRTDIYTLGVMLYELLVGVLPYDFDQLATPATIPFVLREQATPTPSARLSSLGERQRTVALFRHTDVASLIRQVKGDLDWIVMKAMDADRTRRYEAANGLAMDLTRYLNDEPILARPPSLGYRVNKFVRRNLAAVTAGGMAAVAVIVALIVTSISLVQARAAQAESSRQATAAAEVSNLLIGLFNLGDPLQTVDEDISVAEVLERGAQRVRSDLNDQPLVQARMMQAIGRAFGNLGLYDRADTMFTDALRIREMNLPDDDPEVLETVYSLALLRSLQARNAEADTLTRRLVRLYGQSDTPNDRLRLANAISLLARLAVGDFDALTADSLYRRAVEIKEDVAGPNDTSLVGDLVNLAYVNDVDRPGAIAVLNRALRISVDGYGPNHPTTGNVLMNLGLVLSAVLADDTTEAESQISARADSLLTSAIDVYRRAYSSDHPRIGQAQLALADIRENQGAYLDAVQLARSAQTVYETMYGPDHPETAWAWTGLASALRQLGRLDEAEELLRNAIELRRRTLGPDHELTGRAIYDLGVLSETRGDLDRAESLYREARQIQSAAMGDAFPTTRKTTAALSALLRRTGRAAEADSLERMVNPIEVADPRG